MYEVRFTVEGKGEFPFDMLRYDSCHPDRGVDVRAMTVDPMSEEALEAPRKVALVTFRLMANQGPTEARWRSFGWTVADVQPATKIR